MKRRRFALVVLLVVLLVMASACQSDSATPNVKRIEELMQSYRASEGIAEFDKLLRIIQEIPNASFDIVASEVPWDTSDPPWPWPVSNDFIATMKSPVTGYANTEPPREPAPGYFAMYPAESLPPIRLITLEIIPEQKEALRPVVSWLEDKMRSVPFFMEGMEEEILQRIEKRIQRAKGKERQKYEYFYSCMEFDDLSPLFLPEDPLLAEAFVAKKSERNPMGTLCYLLRQNRPELLTPLLQCRLGLLEYFRREAAFDKLDAEVPPELQPMLDQALEQVLPAPSDLWSAYMTRSPLVAEAYFYVPDHSAKGHSAATYLARLASRLNAAWIASCTEKTANFKEKLLGAAGMVPYAPETGIENRFILSVNNPWDTNLSSVEASVKGLFRAAGSKQGFEMAPPEVARYLLRFDYSYDTTGFSFSSGGTGGAKQAYALRGELTLQDRKTGQVLGSKQVLMDQFPDRDAETSIEAWYPRFVFNDSDFYYPQTEPYINWLRELLPEEGDA